MSARDLMGRSARRGHWNIVSKTLRLFGFICASAIALAVFPATMAPAAVPPAPLGLDVDGTEFAIVSNANVKWKVRSNQGVFGAAKVALLVRNPVPGGKSALDRQPYAFTWATTCTAAQQTVTFRRTYFLMGRPKTLAVDLRDTTFQPQPANQAISSVKIYINGNVAFSAPART